MDLEQIPPAAEHLAEAALTLRVTEPGVHTLTFSDATGAVRYDVDRLDTATITAWGLPVTLRALALTFGRNRSCGLYTGVDGYGVHDTATGVTICADLHGNLARTTTAPTGGQREVLTPDIHTAVEEALLAMVAASPGIRPPGQPCPPRTLARTGRTRVPGARVRTGDTGTFVPDWAATIDPHGRWFARVGFAGHLLSTPGEAVTFACGRGVADAIVTEHAAHRQRVAGQLRQAGLRGDLTTAALDREVPTLAWDGSTLVIDERAVTGDARAIRRIPAHEGSYTIASSPTLRWRTVSASACDRTVPADIHG